MAAYIVFSVISATVIIADVILRYCRTEMLDIGPAGFIATLGFPFFLFSRNYGALLELILGGILSAASVTALIYELFSVSTWPPQRLVPLIVITVVGAVCLAFLVRYLTDRRPGDLLMLAVLTTAILLTGFVVLALSYRLAPSHRAAMIVAILVLVAVAFISFLVAWRSSSGHGSAPRSGDDNKC